MLCYVCAAGSSRTTFVSADATLQSAYYYNLTIWYFQGRGSAGLVLAAGISGNSNTTQVRCCEPSCKRLALLTQL